MSAKLTTLHEAYYKAISTANKDNPKKFIELPDELKTETICLAAVSNYFLFEVLEPVLAAIPERYKTRELYLALVVAGTTYYEDVWSFVPEKFLTQDFVLDWARYTNRSPSKGFPEQFYNAEFLKIMMHKPYDRHNGPGPSLSWFKEIPDNLKTPELCRHYVSYGGLITEVPEALITPELRQKAKEKINVNPFPILNELRDPIEAVKNNPWHLKLLTQEQKTKEVCLESVRRDGLTLQFVTEQTLEICEAAVDNCGTALAYAKFQTEEMCLKAVRYHGTNLQFVQNQTGDICLEAVKSDPVAFRFVDSRFIDKDISLAAVKGDGRHLQYIPAQTDGYGDICVEAVRQNPVAIKWVNEQACGKSYDIVCLEAVRRNGQSIDFIKNRSPELCKEALINNPNVFKCFREEEKTMEMCRYAVTHDGRNINYIENQTLELCLAAVRQRANALKYIKKQTEEICLEAVRHNSLAMEWVNEEFASLESIRLAAEKSEKIPNILLNKLSADGDEVVVEEKSQVGKGYTSVEIPDGITMIEKGAFGQNPIKSITLAPSVIFVISGAFLENDNGTEPMSSLTSVTLEYVVFRNDLIIFGDYDFHSGFADVYQYNCRASGTYILDRDTFTWSFNGKQLNYRNHLTNSKINLGNYFYLDGDVITEKNVEEYGHFVEFRTKIDKSRSDNLFIWAYVTLDVPKPFEVQIPETLGNLPVEGFASAGIDKMNFITKITLPSSLKYIADSAFAYCENIRELYIPATVESIGSLAFFACTSLKSITVDPANAYFKVIDGVLFDSVGESLICYPPAKEGSTYDVPAGVRYIRPGAFAYCRELKNITLPAGCCNIGESAFEACEALESIAIPKGILGINERLFNNCICLKKVDLPEGVRVITNEAFVNCVSLEEINIPPSVTFIGAIAFQRCISLEQIHLPGVKSLGDSAFNGCTKLRQISMPKMISLGGELGRDKKIYPIKKCHNLSNLSFPFGCNTINLVDNSRLVSLTYSGSSKNNFCFINNPNLKFSAAYYSNEVQLGNFVAKDPKDPGTKYILDNKSTHIMPNTLHSIEPNKPLSKEE